MNRNSNRGAVIIWMALLALMTGCSEEKVTQQEPTARPVRFVELEGELEQFSRMFTGTVRADHESALSFKVSGTIQTIPVKVGDSVEPGTPLATLDTTDLQVDVEAAVANLKAAQADETAAETRVYTAQSNYNRVEKLYETDNVSLSEFEQARGDFQTAQAQFQAAGSQVITSRSQLQAARNQLKYTTLTAPFKGIVNSITVEENEEITPGKAIMVLSGYENLEVVVNLSDLYIARAEKGMTTSIGFPTIGNERFEGEITEIPYATTDAPTYPVTISVLSKDKRLRPGMGAEIFLNFDLSDEKNGLYLPVDAVGDDMQGNFVFLIDRQGEQRGVVRKQHIEVGHLSEQGFLVEKGLKKGDLVATSGLQLLLDGMEVKLLNDPVNQW